MPYLMNYKYRLATFIIFWLDSVKTTGEDHVQIPFCTIECFASTRNLIPLNHVIHVIAHNNECLLQVITIFLCCIWERWVGFHSLSAHWSISSFKLLGCHLEFNFHIILWIPFHCFHGGSTLLDLVNLVRSLFKWLDDCSIELMLFLIYTRQLYSLRLLSFSFFWLDNCTWR